MLLVASPYILLKGETDGTDFQAAHELGVGY